MSAQLTRPVDFECPWCGPHGVPVDRTLPIYLRLCNDCLPRPTIDIPEPLLPESEAIQSLRAILHKHVAELRTVRWPGAEFGKAIIGNALLGALRAHGADPADELRKAMEASNY